MSQLRQFSTKIATAVPLLLKTLFPAFSTNRRVPPEARGERLGIARPGTNGEIIF
jgi:hypothetical protein